MAAGQAHKVVQIEGQITAIVKALRAVCGHLRSWQVGTQALPNCRCVSDVISSLNSTNVGSWTLLHLHRSPSLGGMWIQAL